MAVKMSEMVAVRIDLRAVRHTCHGVYGVDSLKRVGLRGAFPRGLARLYRRARLVKRSLLNPELGLVPVLEIATGEPTTPVQLAEQLEPELGNLGLLVDVRHREQRQANDVRSRRRSSIEEFDKDIRPIVFIAQGMFRLAGRPDLAERFRVVLLSLRRRRKQEEEAAAPDDATEASADAGATGSEAGEASSTETEAPAEVEAADPSAG